MKIYRSSAYWALAANVSRRKWSNSSRPERPRSWTRFRGRHRQYEWNRIHNLWSSKRGRKVCLKCGRHSLKKIMETMNCHPWFRWWRLDASVGHQIFTTSSLEDGSWRLWGQTLKACSENSWLQRSPSYVGESKFNRIFMSIQSTLLSVSGAETQIELCSLLT